MTQQLIDSALNSWPGEDSVFATPDNRLFFRLHEAVGHCQEHGLERRVQCWQASDFGGGFYDC